MASRIKLSQMVPKSVWKITRDAIIERCAENPEFIAAKAEKSKELDKELRRQFKPSPNALFPDWSKNDEIAHSYVKSLGISPSIVVDTIEVKAGEIMTVTGKSTTNVFSPKHCEYFIGLYHPVTITSLDGEKRECFLPYKGIEPFIELQKEIDNHAFAIRDTSTGKLFKRINYKPFSSGSWGYEVESFEWVDKYTQSKRWADINKIRLWIMGKTGYYDGMPGSEDSVEWAGGSKEFDVPESWEIVEFDKITKTELQVHDLQSWYKRLWELRDLTIKFGSPVRKLYNDLDKKGELDKFKGMLVARVDVNNDATYNIVSYSHELDPNDMKNLDEAIKSLGLSRGDIKRAKDKHCAAIAFSSIDQAVMIKLAYTGQLHLDCIDLETLKETVSS